MQKSVLFVAVAAVAFGAVLLVPSPTRNGKGSIELFGEDLEVEIYGPELPEGTMRAYPVPIVDSVILPESTESAQTTTYVYAADGQDCYHLSTCKFAYASGHRYSVYEARLMGYKPCGRCNPPTE